MNADLERALNGPDADLRAFVASLRAAPQARVRDGFAADVMAAVEAEARRGAFARSLRGLLRPAALFPLAACLVALLAFASLFFRPVPTFSMERLVSHQRADGSFSSSTAAPYVQAFAVTVLAKDPAANRTALEQAVGALVRAQNEEGGWANARLSARNVAALAAATKAGVGMAVPAYRRGRRYLRMHGIGEMTAADMVRDAKEATGRLSSDDAGLACSVALAARL
jgi:hypothetical protein